MANEYSQTLSGKRVCDRGQRQGWTRARAKSSRIATRQSRARLNTELPDRDTSKAKDVSQWLTAGGTMGELAELLDKTPEWSPTVPRQAQSESAIVQPQSFLLRCLPPVCHAMAGAICDIVRVLESLSGCCVLGILSAAIGKGLQIRSGANRVTRGNLYVLPSAESGSGKSETFRHAAKPFIEFETELLERWKDEIKPGLFAERKVLEDEIANLTKSVGKANGSAEREEIRTELKEKLAALDEVETKLRIPALSCEDVTGEKLAVLLAHNGEQLASLSAGRACHCQYFAWPL